MIPRWVVHKFGGTSIADAERYRAAAEIPAGLREYPLDHPFANLSGSDNIVSFQTARYNTQPMIVRPSAGPEVTVAGVFADLLRLASFLGASL
jgi:homoserine dehydrogenase